MTTITWNAGMYFVQLNNYPDFAFSFKHNEIKLIHS